MPSFRDLIDRVSLALVERPAAPSVDRPDGVTRRQGVKLGLAALATAGAGSLLGPTAAAVALPDCEGNLFACLNAVDGDAAGILGCIVPFPIIKEGETPLEVLYDVVEGKVADAASKRVPYIGSAYCFGKLAYANYGARTSCYDSFKQCSDDNASGANSVGPGDVGGTSGSMGPCNPGNSLCGTHCCPDSALCCNCSSGQQCFTPSGPYTDCSSFGCT